MNKANHGNDDTNNKNNLDTVKNWSENVYRQNLDNDKIKQGCRLCIPALLLSLLPLLNYFRYSKISPGWQSNASHIASSVEKRMAEIFPFFIFERLTFDTPTFSDSSFSDILRSAITLSNLSIICPISYPPYSVSSACVCKVMP